MIEGTRVLVVEDDARSRKLVCDLLSLHGCEVFAAATVADGLARAIEHVPDLILMDVQLPDGNGTDTVVRLRADPRTAAIPVVATTALAMKGDRERFLAAGFAGYVSKPIDVHTFVPTVPAFIAPR